jgi:hypothetical protein
MQGGGGVNEGVEGFVALAVTAGHGLEALDQYFAKYLPQLVLTVIATPVIVVVMWWQDWISGLTVILTIPLIPLFMVLIGLAYIADASVSPTIVAAVTDNTGGPGHREGDAWPARPHGNFDGVSPGDRPDVDHRRASISRALTTGGLDLPRLQTDRVLPGERLHERARDERRSREYTHSRDNMINELMHPKGSLLPRPFAMIGMAPNNDNRAGPSNGLHRAKTSGDLRGAETHDGAHDGRPRSPRKPLGTSGVETGGTELSPRNKPMTTVEYDTETTKVEELSPEMKRHNGPREDLREAEPGRGDGRGI